MGDVQTGSQESALSSPEMKAAASTIGSQLNTQLRSGVKPYNQPLYTGLSSTTRAGVNSLAESANAGAGGLGDAFGWANGVVNNGGYNDALRGAQSGVQGYLAESQADAPGYAAMRARVADDAGAMANATFTNSGRFGGGTHREGLGEGIGNALAGMDMQNYENRLGRMLGGNQALAGIGQTAMGNAGGAASSMPGLFSGTLLPGQAHLAAGQILDADTLATRQDDARRFDETQNAGWNTLQRGSSIFAGTAPVSGTTKTESQPWWKVGTGLGFQALGLA